MANCAVSMTIPSQTSISPRAQYFTRSNSWLHHSTTKFASKYTVPLSSSSSSSESVSVVEDDPSSSPEATVRTDFSTFSGCKVCGREEIERGCNGEGRIQGGIATVPGFGWWPIKAYRPCPGFLASGGRYRRTGQSMDEVAFGRGGGKTTRSSNTTSTEAKSR